MSSNTNDLSTSLGALVGMMMGGPGGAVAGSMVGNLMSGGTFQSAMESGIGSLVTSGLGGKAGLAMNLLGNMGGASPQQRGSNFLDMFSNMQGSAPRPMQRQPMTAMTSMFNPLQTVAPSSGGTAMGGIGNLLGNILPGITDESLLRAMAMQMVTGKDNPMNELQLAQMRTGERNPSYRGTPVIRAEGGMIEGPGTGKSDSIPAAIYQDGGRVQEARLSDGEFVMTADAVKGAGNGNRARGAANMYKMMNKFERMA